MHCMRILVGVFTKSDFTSEIIPKMLSFWGYSYKWNQWNESQNLRHHVCKMIFIFLSSFGYRNGLRSKNCDNSAWKFILELESSKSSSLWKCFFSKFPPWYCTWLIFRFHLQIKGKSTKKIYRNVNSAIQTFHFNCNTLSPSKEPFSDIKSRVQSCVNLTGWARHLQICYWHSPSYL